MTDQPIAAEPPAPAPTAKKVYERKTRVPDWLTNVVLVTTAVFGIWAVALVVLTFIGITQPAFYGTQEKAAIKALGSTVVVLLTFSQFYTMESVLGHLPRGSIKMRSMLKVHRIGGRLIIVLAALIAFFCMVDVGAPSNPLRVLVHVTAGSTAFALLAIKFALIRWKPYLAYDTAPWIGRVVAVCFVAIWLTSGYAFFTNQL
ncbi:MAG: hypothetical protein QOJ81_707 [Chloroflexota bacterium]|jgi:hypothetical protein|nr:hypothetical protein [Chloroflexota bacterium]